MPPLVVLENNVTVVTVTATPGDNSSDADVHHASLRVVENSPILVVVAIMVLLLAVCFVAIYSVMHHSARIVVTNTYDDVEEDLDELLRGSIVAFGSPASLSASLTPLIGCAARLSSSTTRDVDLLTSSPRRHYAGTGGASITEICSRKAGSS